MRKIILATILLSVSGSVYSAPVSWSCGSWKADAAGKCEEVRVCTRTLCDAKGKLSNCRTETKTECANPIPPKAATPSSRLNKKAMQLEQGRSVKSKTPSPAGPIPIPLPNIGMEKQKVK